jgi:catechol 2,3-dioxygenase-like lactoylglutathione lyase family enzyme
MIEGISAVTLATHEMSRAVRFYRALGFEVLHGGEQSSFTSFRAGVRLATYREVSASRTGFIRTFRRKTLLLIQFPVSYQGTSSLRSKSAFVFAA